MSGHNILNETVLTIAQAAKRLPAFRGGKKASPATVWRWIFRGLELPDGSRLHLEAVKLGSWITSQEAIERFGQRLAAVRVLLADPTQIRSPAQKRRSIESAKKQLAIA